MPNLIMEYTDSVEEQVNVQSLLEDLHRVMLTSGLFMPDAVKSRAIRIHQWLVGEYSDAIDFIHVSVELLDGRSREQKSELGENLLNVLKDQASHIPSLTINIRDMDRAVFKKYAANGLK